MSLDADDRYETALDLAADVERYLADEPIAAYEEPWKRRTRRWIQRHSTLTQVVAACVLAIVVAGTAMLHEKKATKIVHGVARSGGL